MKRLALIGSGLVFVLIATAVAAGAVPTFRPGAAGIGDPYFPMDGNGGYDVKAYDLELAYDPATDVLDGVATIDLVATSDLSRFNLDLDGLTVHTVTVDGVAATFQRANGELKITPASPLATGTRVPVVVTYDGIPQPLPPEDDGGGFIPSDDGALVVGEPHVAAVWFPVNDHPRDKARYHFEVTVPDGLEVVANGHLVSQDSAAGFTTWVWDAPAPMASYLATVTIGEFDLDQYQDPTRPPRRRVLPRRRRPVAVGPPRPAHREPHGPLPGRPADLQAPQPLDRGSRRRRHPVLLGQSGDGVGLGPRRRRGPHRGRRRLDDPARRQRPHQHRAPASPARSGWTCTRS